MPTLPPPPDWSLSVVSHGHLPEVRRLLLELRRTMDVAHTEVLVTLNQPEPEVDLETCWPGRLRVIRNARPAGFAANHNAAIQAALGTHVAMLDPDLHVHGDPFPALKRALADPRVGLVSTRVLDPDGTVADHARPLPTPARLLRRHALSEPLTYDAMLAEPIDVDWLAGLFIATRRETFIELGGFDAGYRMYCEDVDLCLRARNAGLSVRVIPGPWVTHPARRQTLRRPQHFLWHVGSLLRLWRSPAYRQFQSLRSASAESR